MTVTMTPIAGADPTPGSYLTVAAARELGAALPDLGALLDKSDTELAVLLFAASLDLDAAMPYQGVKCDTSGAQEREFPRHPGSTPGSDGTFGVPGAGAGVWDWDDETDAAVVPQQVQIACLHQAASLLDPQFRARLEAIRGGLSAQSVGSLSESYVRAADLPGGASGGGLCDRAQRLMDRYRLRSAPLL